MKRLGGAATLEGVFHKDNHKNYRIFNQGGNYLELTIGPYEYCFVFCVLFVIEIHQQNLHSYIYVDKNSLIWKLSFSKFFLFNFMVMFYQKNLNTKGPT